MNIFEQKFMEKLSKDNADIQDVVCYQFEEGNDGYMAPAGGGLFIAHVSQGYSAIKIRHCIESNCPDVRFKMYYAKYPNNEFKEELSLELGFMSGEEYEKIVSLPDTFDAFRFDFGPHPIQFEIKDFKISIPTREEVEQLTEAPSKASFSNLLHNWRKVKNVVPYIRQFGIGRAVAHLMEVVKGEDTVNQNAKSTQQVVEPYRVTLKHEREPERKKVLHFIENFHTGGSSRLIIDIIEYYGHKYENKIFTMAYRGDEEFLNIDVEVIDVEKKDLLLKKIEQENPDIIHVHIWEGEWYHKVFDILDEVKDRVIIENINTPIAPIVRDYIKKYVFVSNYVVEQFYNVNDLRTTVIYPGSNFEMFTRNVQQKNYLAHDTIGMVYRLGYDKLNRKSIDVFIRTVQKRPQTKALIVGGGPQYDYYIDKVKTAKVFDNFVFTGYVPYVTLPDWYKKFTIFVAPVWQESFGQVSPFAMSMGMPVAGYRVGALNEIINNETLLAEPDNVEELSDILVRLLDDYDKCVEIGKNNQKRAQELFGVQKMVDDYYALYQEVLK